MAVTDYSGVKMESGALFPPSWQGLRQQIIYLAQFGNSIQVIHGKSGAGKSTFFRHSLEAGLGSPTIGVQVHPRERLDAFFRAVVEEIGLRPVADASVGQLISMLRGFVQTLHKDRSRAVLLVDDAHNLGDSELGALVSVLQGNSEPGIGLHVVLFAEPGFANHLDELQVLEVAVHDAPLPPFTAAEIHQLLKLQQVRMNVAVESPDQAQRIWQQSHGLPGVAIALLEELRPAPAANTALSLRGLPIGHLAALIVLSVVLIWAFLARQPSELPINSREIPAVPIPTEQTLVKPPMTEPFGDQAHQAHTTPSSDSEVLLPSVTPPEQEEQTSSPVSVEQTTPVRMNSPAEPVIVEQNDPPPPKADANEETAKQDAKANAAALAAAQEPVTPANAPTEVRAKKPAPASSLEESEKRLLAYPPNAFVLQLMATLDLDKLISFVAQQPNAANLHVYSTTRDTKLLYILVEGYYADKDSAQAAVANLPSKQREGGPWPKKVEQVQQEIRKNRKL